MSVDWSVRPAHKNETFGRNARSGIIIFLLCQEIYVFLQIEIYHRKDIAMTTVELRASIQAELDQMNAEMLESVSSRCILFGYLNESLGDCYEV